MSYTAAFVALGVRHETLERSEFYRQDIEILKELGYKVVIVNEFRRRLPRVDIAFVWWWTWLWHLGPRFKRAGTPIVATGTLDPLQFDSRPKWQKLLLAYGCNFPSKNVFVSEYVRKGMQKRIGVKRAEVCPHIIPDEYFPDAGVSRDNNLIYNVAWKKRENVIRKMQPELIDAFAIAKTYLPELQLVLAGAPMDGEKLLRQQVAHLGVTKDVRFLGNITRSEKINLLRRCGQYYQCSQSEGFGVAIGEAMACGAPVVVNRHTAIPEVVGDCGYYVANDSPRAIAETMVQVAANRDGARRVGAAAARRIDSTFRAGVRREYFRRVLAEAIGHKG